MVFPLATLLQVSDLDLFDIMNRASAEGELVILQSLLPRLRTISTDITTDMRALLRSASNSGQIATIKFLLAKGTVLFPHTQAPPRLARALSFGPPSDAALSLFQTFIRLGWDVNTKIPIYGNCLRHALVGWNLPLVKLLIENGADVNVETIRSYPTDHEPLRCFSFVGSTTPLCIAAIHCSSDYLEVLLDHGARLDNSPVFHKIASRNDHDATNSFENLQFLLDRGVDINAIESLRERARARVLGTALQYAAANENLAMVRFLLEKGADVTLVDSGGYETALDWARHPVYREEDGIDSDVVKLLSEAERAAA